MPPRMDRVKAGQGWAYPHRSLGGWVDAGPVSGLARGTLLQGPETFPKHRFSGSDVASW